MSKPLDLGDQPSEWTRCRLKDVTTWVNRGVAPTYADADTGALAFSQKCVRPDLSVAPEFGRPIELESVQLNAPARLRVDDVVVNSTGRGTLGRAAVVRGLPPEPLVADGHVTVVRVKEERVSPRFLVYLLGTQAFYEQANACLAIGSTNQTELGREALRRIRLALPSAEAQSRVATYLDAETARIDELIAEQGHTRDLLDERVFSLYVQLVSEAEVAVVPLRRVLRSIADGPFGSAFTSDTYTDSGAAIVRLGNIGFAEYRHHPQAFIPMELFHRFSRHAVHPGDLLVAGLGDDRNHAGRSCVAPDLGPTIVKGKCFVASVEPARASPDYLALFLSSPLGRAAVGVAARGSTRTMINLEITKSTLVSLPDLSVQRDIAATTENARRSIRPLMMEIESQIALLRERRQALITQAVTHGIEGLPGVA